MVKHLIVYWTWRRIPASVRFGTNREVVLRVLLHPVGGVRTAAFASLQTCKTDDCYKRWLRIFVTNLDLELGLNGRFVFWPYRRIPASVRFGTNREVVLRFLLHMVRGLRTAGFGNWLGNEVLEGIRLWEWAKFLSIIWRKWSVSWVFKSNCLSFLNLFCRLQLQQGTLGSPFGFGTVVNDFSVVIGVLTVACHHSFLIVIWDESSSLG